MDILHNLVLGFGAAASPMNLLFCLIGCLLGTLVGVLPGIGPVATIAMLLPLTYGLSPLGAPRKGDHLSEFFSTFRRMHEALGERARAEVAILDEAIAESERAGTFGVTLHLKRLRVEKGRLLRS